MFALQALLFTSSQLPHRSRSAVSEFEWHDDWFPFTVGRLNQHISMQILSRPAHFVYPLLINVSQLASSMLLLIVLQTISKNKIIGKVTK